MKHYIENLYFNDRNQFGIPALFYIFIGGRGIGKTFRTQKYCLRKFFKKREPFLWLRLTEPSVKKLLDRNGANFIDSKLVQEFNIKDIKTKGNSIYVNGREMCTILALSTFYSTKGVALNKANQEKVIKKSIKKYKTIVLDEMNREKNEKKTFDIQYAFVNQLENICRLDTDRRIILLGNTLDEAQDIMSCCFNFIPEDFGRYHLKKKKAVVEYVRNSKTFTAERQKQIFGLLMPDAQTVTNKITSDTDLVYHGPVGNQQLKIQFDNDCYFTLCGDIITEQKVPRNSKIPIIAMRPYLVGLPFYKERQNQIITRAQQRLFLFDKLITLKKFYREIKLIKGE